MSYLQSQYILKLKEYEFSFPQFHGNKLRQLLPNHEIGSQIALTTFHLGSTGFISFILIYNANFTVPNAVKFTYELDSKDSVIEAAEYP